MVINQVNMMIIMAGIDGDVDHMIVEVEDHREGPDLMIVTMIQVVEIAMMVEEVEVVEVVVEVVEVVVEEKIMKEEEIKMGIFLAQPQVRGL